jgi:hypothetical protein
MLAIRILQEHKHKFLECMEKEKLEELEKQKR